jgi:glycosyltransferase involved in cell wall biosynthesis
MVESLACGTPVVTSPIGAAPEIVEDGVTGFLCSTPQAMRAAVESVDQLDRARCRDAVSRRFTVERMVDGYLDVYERAVARGPWSPAPVARQIEGPARQVDPIAAVRTGR